MPVPSEKRSIYHNVLPPMDQFDSGGRYVNEFVSNEIHSTKYSLLTFVPKNLFEQFRRLANTYFIIIVILQCLPQFSLSNPFYAAMPITGIILVTMAKDAFEDWKRYKSDKEINNSNCKILEGQPNFNFIGQNGGCFDLLKYCRSRKVNSNDIEMDDFQMNLFSFPETSDSTRAEWGNICWKDVRVGDIVYLENNESIPADILILATSEVDNLCYVETKNLDGETNLKLKKGPINTENLKQPEVIQKTRFCINAEPPNTALYSFNGVLSLHQASAANAPIPLASSIHTKSNTKIPITINELLLRGCTIRNTKWIIGIVLYTGVETKIVLNSGKTPSKRSLIEKQMNPQVFTNFLLLICLSSITAVGTGFFTNRFSGAPFLISSFQSVSSRNSVYYEGLLTFLSSVILMQNIVPISLYVTTEFVKTFQALFIYYDILLYYEEYDLPCSPKTWTIADDLGQIEYLFSDKTGTLTRNLMEFRKCSIGGIVYGGYHSVTHEDPNDLTSPVETGSSSRKRKYDPNARRESVEIQMMSSIKTRYKNPYLDNDTITFVDPKFVNDLFQANEQSAKIKDFFLLLAVCHTVLAEYPDDSNDYKILYKAQSPDEAALVTTAKNVGLTFLERVGDKMDIEVLGDSLQMEILNIIEFNSTRKRMSVFARAPNGLIILYCKGADSIIYERLETNSGAEMEQMKQTTLTHLEEFAASGLRTLCLAYRVIKEEDYEKWSNDYHKASLELVDREAKMDRVAEEIEKDLILLGATAIEDRLQDGVPECIARLAKGGIKIWVLTGDKMETAINIGLSCNLLTKNMTLITIQGVGEEVKKMICDALSKFFNVQQEQLNEIVVSANNFSMLEAEEYTNCENHALVIDGPSLQFALESECSKLFTELATRCKAVICCRVSPRQKGEVVALIKKEKNAMTLAIGDGANDVSMIQQANIGVGIQGQEGMQAVQASDYAIAQFRFLNRLLLVHGRLSFIRTAEMTLQMFYKNIVWTLVLFWFQIFCGFSAALEYDYNFILYYNLFFTSLPPLAIGIFDQDLKDGTALATPQIYKRGINGEFYSIRHFLLYVLDGVYQSLIVFFIGYFCFHDSFIEPHGFSADIKQMGTFSATIAVFVANFYMGLNSYSWPWLTFLFVWGSPVIFLVFVIVLSYFKHSSLSGIVINLYATPQFWLGLLLAIVMCLFPRYLIKFVRSWQFPNDTDILREMEKFKPEGIDRSDKELDSLVARSDKHRFTSTDRLEPGLQSGENLSVPVPYRERRKKSFIDTKIAPALNRVRSILQMRSGKLELNTGFAFSHEPGVAEHLKRMSSPTHGSLRREASRLRNDQLLDLVPVIPEVIPERKEVSPLQQSPTSPMTTLKRKRLSPPYWLAYSRSHSLPSSSAQGSSK